MTRAQIVRASSLFFPRAEGCIGQGVSVVVGVVKSVNVYTVNRRVEQSALSGFNTIPWQLPGRCIAEREKCTRARSPFPSVCVCVCAYVCFCLFFPTSQNRGEYRDVFREIRYVFKSVGKKPVTLVQSIVATGEQISYEGAIVVKVRRWQSSRPMRSPAYVVWMKVGKRRPWGY